MQQLINQININGYEHEITNLGMVKQVNPEPFVYDEKYLSKQSTNLEMAYLRLGYLFSHLPVSRYKNCTCLELGPGTGVFFNEAKKIFKKVDGYDIAESKYTTVSKDDLLNKKWDFLFAFDVIEHMHNIDDIFDIDFNYGYFSSPNPPDEIDRYKNWRHFKPNEHVCYFSKLSFRRWIEKFPYTLLSCSNIEDAIRIPQPGFEPNINSFIIARIRF